jgi:hypothetical protein
VIIVKKKNQRDINASIGVKKKIGSYLSRGQNTPLIPISASTGNLSTIGKI